MLFQKLCQSFHYDPTVTPKNVYLALAGLSPHWREIGKLLNVPREELHNMEFAEPEISLYEVILSWTKDPFGKITWATIRSVITSLDKDYHLKLDTFLYNLYNIKNTHHQENTLKKSYHTLTSVMKKVGLKRWNLKRIAYKDIFIEMT